MLCQDVELLSLTGRTTFLRDAPLDVAALRKRISEHEGVPACHLRLKSSGRELCDGAMLDGHTPPVVHVLLRLFGGKGGFGAMLRTAGARGVKTTNFDACRDLNGRRLRHVNAEARLREWDARAEERKLKKQQEDAKNAKPRGPQIARFDDDEYDEMLEGARNRVADALAAGLAADTEGAGGSGSSESAQPEEEQAAPSAGHGTTSCSSNATTGTAAGKRKAEHVTSTEEVGSSVAPPKAAKLNAAFDPLAGLGGDEDSSDEEDLATK